MLTENDVIDAVASYLVSKGYNIVSQCSTVQQGIDIVAVCKSTNARVLVEAKGGTSSKNGSSRFGKPFTLNQAKNHVAVAFYYAAKLLQNNSELSPRIALAFPDDDNHRLLINNIITALEILGISVFFVDECRNVRMIIGQPI